MKKIPTLFVRDPDDRKHVTRTVTPGCEWVIEGEGVATRKYDGTCVLVRDGRMYGRREVKPGRSDPPNFEQVHFDEVTGKKMGWVLVTRAPEWTWHWDALKWCGMPEDGTYELCGPKIGNNPEGLVRSSLISHEYAERFPDAPRDFDGLREWLLARPFEGIVWHHEDGRMAKIKRRDFAPTNEEAE